MCFKDQNGTFVVVELKKGNADVNVLGQIARYLDEVSVSKKPKKLIGIILCRKASIGLKNAVANPKTIADLGHGHEITIDEYEFNIEFPKIQKLFKPT